MQRWMRIAAVTGALIAAGGIFGTIVGALVLGVWVLTVDGAGPGLAELRFVMEYAIVIGGAAGAVLGPIAAWVLMRHVPLWLAVGGTTLGTLAGGGLAALATGDPVLGMYGGAAGFAATAIGLRLRVPRERRLSAG